MATKLVNGVIVELTAEEDAQLLVDTAAGFEQKKLLKLASLEAAYQAEIEAPISYLGATFQADEYSQQVLVKSLSGGALYAPDFWQDIDNVMHTMTFEELQGLSGVMLARGKPAYINLQTKKAAVRAATTIQQVEAITWNN